MAVTLVWRLMKICQTTKLKLPLNVLLIGNCESLDFKAFCKILIPRKFSPAVELVYCGHLGTGQKCPDYQGVLIFQVIVYDKVPFETSSKCVNYSGVYIFKCPH